MNRIGIIAALKPEIQTILDNPNFQWQELEPNLFYSNRHEIYLVISGVGKVFAAYALSKIIHKIDTVISIGTSGALTQDKAGSVFLCTEFVEHDMDASGLGFAQGITPFSEMKEAVLSNCTEQSKKIIKDVGYKIGIKINHGRIISGDQFFADPQLSKEKKELFNAHLVDMESAAVAKICVHEKKEFLALRYISDNANSESGSEWQENVKNSSQLFNRMLEALFSNTKQ